MQDARQPGRACWQRGRVAHSERPELPRCPAAVQQQPLRLLLQASSICSALLPCVLMLPCIVSLTRPASCFVPEPRRAAEVWQAINRNEMAHLPVASQVAIQYRQTSGTTRRTYPLRVRLDMLPGHAQAWRSAGRCLCRFLFILGHLLRYGMDTMEAAEQPEERAVTADGCRRVFLAFYDSPEHANGGAAILTPALVTSF